MAITITTVSLFSIVACFLITIFLGFIYGSLYSSGGLVKVIERGGGGSSTLAGLRDVDLISPVSGNSLVYNGTKWTNITLLGPMATVSILGSGNTTVMFNISNTATWINPFSLSTPQLVSNSSPLWQIIGNDLKWLGADQEFAISYEISIGSPITTDNMKIGLGIGASSPVIPQNTSIGNIDFISSSNLTSFSGNISVNLLKDHFVAILFKLETASVNRNNMVIGRAAITLIGSTPL